MEGLDKKLVELAKKYGMIYVGLFGSVARGDFDEKSDIDLLVKFSDKKVLGLFDLVKIEDEMEDSLGREVDLITKLNKYVQPYVEKDLRTIYEER